MKTIFEWGNFTRPFARNFTIIPKAYLMFGQLRAVILVFLLLSTWSSAEHLIVAGGPALRRWENYRTKDDQHDRWWANFIRASTLRMVELRKAYGSGAKITWMVYQPAYLARGREDSQPYTAWIAEQAAKRQVSLVWFNSTGNFIQTLNNRSRGSVQTFDFFGHSNRYAFMFEYSTEILAVSTATLHENDLSRIKGSIFDRNAYCKSWGCHTGESMSAVWKRSLGIALEGARGPTTYTVVGQGKMPAVRGSWVR